MALYNVASWVSTEGTLSEVADQLRAKLETLDETTGARVDGGVVPLPGSYNRYQAWLVHKG